MTTVMSPETRIGSESLRLANASFPRGYPHLTPPEDPCQCREGISGRPTRYGQREHQAIQLHATEGDIHAAPPSLPAHHAPPLHLRCASRGGVQHSALS